MCGIVGYIGNEQAGPILLDGLSKLEYRGYDSAGIAVRNGTNAVEIIKTKGRLRELAEKTDGGNALKGSVGIGHTRWATHGEPSMENAHPHFSDDNAIVAVHNGIIENYQDLKEKLLKKGYTFSTQTDTEVATKLIDYYHKKYKGTPLESIARSMMRIRGSYALAILFADHPDEIYAVRRDSPMIIGTTQDAAYLASDVPAILKYTRSVYYIDNMEIARLKAGRVDFFTVDEEPIEKTPVTITWDAEAAEKAGYEHFMIKEIHEQPRAVRDTINSIVKEGKIDLSGVGLTDEMIRGFRSIRIVACGSAYHVGVALQYVFEDIAEIPVTVDIASEFRYRRVLIDKDTLVVIISQSGETADSLAALREAKNLGSPTLAIVNVVGSSIAREADHVIYTMAGPEIAVATTKAYSTQLVAGYLMALAFADVRGRITQQEYERYVGEIDTIPSRIERILEDKERIQWFAAKNSGMHDAFYIGRGLDYAVCLEGSLKLKEISYIHSEAYAAGELKHGTISLIEDKMLVISLITQNALYEKMNSNMAEVKSRGAYVMGITTYGNYNVEDIADFTVYIPKIDPHFTASLAVVPLQLMGYYVSIARGLDVDKPRNLAKSVTVE